MLDTRLLLEEPDRVAGLLATRGVDPAEVRATAEALRLARETAKLLDTARESANRQTRDHARAARGTEPSEDGAPPPSRSDLRAARARVTELEDQHRSARREARARVLALPNLPEEKAPRGTRDTDSALVGESGPPDRGHAPPAHWVTAEADGWSDAARSVKLSGHGFSVLRGDGARLLRALVAFGLDLHRGTYEELVLPQLVRGEAMVGSGHLPEFADGVYRVEDEDLYAVPTAEVPVTALHRDELLTPQELPLLYMMHSTCFRRAAGASGGSSRGMQRLHEYHQVELARIVSPADSHEHFRMLLTDAERALVALGLPYRVLDVCTGRLPFAAALARRLDVYSAGTRSWLPVSTVSLFTDFQARRSGIRVGTPRGRTFPHTLNASALAASRLWGVLIENGLRDDGRVVLPEALRTAMDTDVLRPRPGRG
ncbi:MULTISPECIES: aminoacyl--tRNA ligase-related protein [unclassified Streptomyces]|uniref:aminoacyl--tRNA ligase-related protein n=1 Tax=unclassified Streptomyces TaxID=2593676 RepID=UPI000DAD25C1|nr:MULTISPECIES: aminoacyl--tRNA ligase-related protein [unclassified Streptomyces]PZT72146.1 serine--tRNA ligase [Streptomyces sp. AC1-42T]PZT81533.1 serine--tRNA ligase [Streptomyces sp. AC1-42W]